MGREIQRPGAVRCWEEALVTERAKAEVSLWLWLWLWLLLLARDIVMSFLQTEVH